MTDGRGRPRRGHRAPTDDAAKRGGAEGETTRIVCERCGTVMFDRHCKVVCPNCGYLRDCSDP